MTRIVSHPLNLAGLPIHPSNPVLGGDRMKRARKKTVSNGEIRAVQNPQQVESTVAVSADEDDPHGLWKFTMSLPDVQNFMATDWNRILPPDVATTFLGVAIAVACGYTGDYLWKDLTGFVEGVMRPVPTPEQKPVVDFLVKRFKDYYGEYERTPKGLVKVLTDLGLVILYQVKGKDVMEIPAVLPTAEERLNLCMVDVDEKVVFKARYRDNAGPRERVTYDQVPAIKRMLNAGWARHLPPDLSYAFMAAAAVAVSRCTGALMWENIEDLWKAQREHKNPLLPKRKADEVEERFREEYARPFKRTARGAISVLLDLGLLVKSKVDGEDFLEVPDILPTPDMRLFLTEVEKGILAERLKIVI